MKRKYLPGDTIRWALGGLFDDGVPRRVMEGEVLRITDFGYVVRPNDTGVVTQLFTPGWGMSVAHRDIVEETRP